MPILFYDCPFYTQCRIQSYFEAGIPVWDPKLKPQTIKSDDLWCKLSSTILVTEPREQCFELFKTQNRQKITRVLPLDPTGEGLQRCPRLPSCSTVFLLTMLVEKPAPTKNCWIRHWYLSNFLILAYTHLYMRIHTCLYIPF